MTKTETRNAPIRLARVASGEPLSASKHNRLIETVNRNQRIGLFAREIINTQAAQFQVQQFKVAAVSGDYLRCNKLDGPYDAQEDEGVYYVAKPYLLRRTPFDTVANGGDALVRDGITYEYSSDTTRTATNESAQTEDQTVVPSYEVGDVIYAATNIQGFRLAIQRIKAPPIDVQWIDQNLDGRMWGQA